MRLGKHMFFSVIHKRLPNPAFYAPHAAGTTIESVLPTTAMTITSHDMVVADQHCHMAYVTHGSGTQAFGAMDAQALFSASAFNLRELESLRRATPKPELHYFIEPDPDSKLMPQEFAAMRFVLGAMMQAKAKPAGDADGALYIVHANQTGRAANLKALSELQRMGCVEQVGADGQQSSWRFTYLGMSRLVLCTAVPFGNHACKQLLSVRRDVPLRDLNEYELLVMIKEIGWVHENLERRALKATLAKGFAKAAYVPGAEKRWHTLDARTHVEKLYLLALLSSDELGITVPHFKSAAVYLSLVGPHLGINMRSRLRYGDRAAKSKMQRTREPGARKAM